MIGEPEQYAGNAASGDCNSEQSILDAFAAPPPVVTLPLADVSLTVPGGALALPAGRAKVGVTAGDAHRREGPALHGVRAPRRAGRLLAHRQARRDQAAPGGTVSQSIKFGTTAADPAGAYTVSLLAAEGSVPMSAAGDAEVLATLPATKLGGAGLRAARRSRRTRTRRPVTATLRFAVAEAGGRRWRSTTRWAARWRARSTAPWTAWWSAFDASALPAGLYVARLTTAGRTETVRLTVVR